jgi:hypothetical protein
MDSHQQQVKSKLQLQHSALNQVMNSPALSSAKASVDSSLNKWPHMHKENERDRARIPELSNVVARHSSVKDLRVLQKIG